MTTYTYLWRNKFLATHTTSLDEFITVLQKATETLVRWRDNGVIMDKSGSVEDDYAIFSTTDPVFAKQEGFEEEDKFEDEDFGEGEE